MGEPSPSERGKSRATMEALEASGRGRIVPPQEDRHRARCPVCQLDDLGELERAYLAWTTVPELAQLYKLEPAAIRRHAAYYSLALFRAASINLARARIVAAGLEQREDITPEHALRALDQLGAAVGAARPGAGGDPGAADPAGLSWERELRLTIRGTTGADSQLAAAAGGDGLAGADPVLLAQAGGDDQAGQADPSGVAAGTGWPEP